jgi:cell shape-determining protein MreC
MNRLFSPRPRYRNGLLNGTSSVVAVIITVLLVIAVILRFVAPGVFSRITTPIWNIGTSLTTSVRGTATTDSKSSLRTERDQLSAENAVLAAQNATLTAQVEDLTALLGSRTEPEKGIVAGVLARPPVAPYDVLIIDQGTEAGVTVGARAFGPGGTPIGTIGEVHSRQSRIALFSTSGFKNEGWVGSGRIPLTLTGAGAGAFRATVAKQAGVIVGDSVYLPGNGASPIGTVIKIESDPSSPTVELEVRPYTNPFSTTWVTVAR